LTGNGASPCPQCVSGTCTYGERAGLPCSGGVGSRNTTIECPPKLSGFLGRLTIALAGLTTGTATASDPAGNFCPGQAHPGAFGGEAGTIRETGSPAARDLSNPFESTIAGDVLRPLDGQSGHRRRGRSARAGRDERARHDDRDPASALSIAPPGGRRRPRPTAIARATESLQAPAEWR